MEALFTPLPLFKCHFCFAQIPPPPLPSQRMFRCDEVLFEEAFGYGCPKFITASPPAFDNPTAAAPQEVRRAGRDTRHSTA